MQLADKVGDRRARIHALGYLALISAEHGQLADAEHQIRKASGSAVDLAEVDHFVDAMVSLAVTRILDARDDSAAALDAADMAVMLARQSGAILVVAKALLARAEILDHRGDHQTAKASLSEVGVLVRNCADAGITATLLASAERSAGVAATSGTGDYVIGEELTPKEREVLQLLATRLSRRETQPAHQSALPPDVFDQPTNHTPLALRSRIGNAVSSVRNNGSVSPCPTDLSAPAVEQSYLPPAGSGRRRLWCSQKCRRAAYEERRAARSGAIGLRVERVVEQIEKPVWCVEYRDRVVEVIPPPPDPAQAAAIVLTSPHACRVVLDSLTDAATQGTLHRGEHAATVRSAARLLTALRAAQLLT